MREFVLISALICLLTWTQADRQAALKPHRRARMGRVQPGAANTERVVGRLRPGFGSALSIHGSSREVNVQADEGALPAIKKGAFQGRGGGSVARRSGLPRQSDMLQDEGAQGSRARGGRMPSGSGSPNLLASFAGKNRVLVISAPHESDGYYRLMMSLLKSDVYCDLAERHVHQIVMFHQEGEMGGKVRRISPLGKIFEEPLDTVLIPRLMSFLKLEKGEYMRQTSDMDGGRRVSIHINSLW